jgi:GH15 family glucan-1,4-alpha-glucosidase
MSKAVSDYAFLGDGRTAALIDKNGDVAWLCWPRFDSNACFAAILGGNQFGHWSVAPTSKFSSRRHYLEQSLILETTFESETGTARLRDFLCFASEAQRFVRIVTGVSGTVVLKQIFAPRSGNGKYEASIRRVGEDLIADGASPSFRLQSSRPSALSGEEFTVGKNDEVTFVLSDEHARSFEAAATAQKCFEEETRFWSDWCAHCTYEGPWRSVVMRSLIILKALIFAPTGGIIAAPTTSLPEEIGGRRNWDYRYCWLRDSTFTVLALLHAGYKDEAAAWVAWLQNAVAPDKLRTQPVYGVAGEKQLQETEADWLPGFCGSRPVRFGNDAYRQYQLDIYGEVQDTLHQWRRLGGTRVASAWPMQCEMLGRLEALWQQPDDGIWEQRGHPECFTQSRGMAWAAVDRMIKSAEQFGFDGPLDSWRELRSRIHSHVCENAFDENLNAFTRSYGSHSLDASTLLLPMVGFLPADDPRMRGTVDAVIRHLGHDGFIYRYDQSREDDGIRQDEGAFLPCSFWLADNLILQKRFDEAAVLFENVLGAENDVGLLSEEYDPSARMQLGNTPQALAHLSLVHTALNLRGHGPAHSRAGIT